MLRKDYQFQRCCSFGDEPAGEEKTVYDVLECEKPSKQGKRMKKNASIAKKRSTGDAEVVGSVELDGYKGKVSSDNHGDQKAMLAKKFHVGGSKKPRVINKIMTRSSKRKSQIHFGVPHLSKEIIFNILVRLPADIIYDAIRYVSVEWYNIVRDPYFINAHLRQSTSIVFLQSQFFPEFVHSVEVTETDMKITKLRYPFRGPVWATCDGLVLYGDVLNRYILHVANPITKQHVSLPPLIFSNGGVWSLSTCGLAYASSTGDYKVVVYAPEKVRTTVRTTGANTITESRGRLLIITVGIDSAWREVDTKNASELVSNKPISVGGFIFFNIHNSYPCYPCLDVNTEKFHQIVSPIAHDMDEHDWVPMVMGNLLTIVSEARGFSYEVWALTKPRIGEWVRMPNIDVEGLWHIYDRILYPTCVEFDINCLFLPKAWVKNGEVMIFHAASPLVKRIISLNLKTGKVYLQDLDEYTLEHVECRHPHIHSLVSFRSQLV